MLLQEVFDQLACAELNNISVVDQVTKQIDPESYAKVATAVNAGLTALHTRFLLRKGELTVNLQPDATWYKLVKRNPAVVADTDFRDNLLKVQQVFTNCGRELSMNNHSDYWSVSESSYDTIKVPAELQTKGKVTSLKVVYRQDHKMIPIHCQDIEPDCYGLTLPRSHLWALCLFVASRMHIPVGLQDATYSGNSFMALYNSECDRLQTTGLEVVDIGISYGVVRKGFP